MEVVVLPDGEWLMSCTEVTLWEEATVSEMRALPCSP